MTIMAQAQKCGGMVAYIDFENCFDANYSSALGVDVDSILISQPQTGEEGVEICEKLIRSNSFDVIAIDSVAAAVPKAELEGDPGEAHMGRAARLWAQTMRKLVGAACKTNTAIILINQVRSNMSGYGPTESTPCGKAIPFFSTLRLDVRKVEQIKGGVDAIVGQKVKIKSVKNRLSAPYRETVVDLIYGVGFSREGSVLDAAVDNEVVAKAGAWYSFNGERLGQGRDAVIENLRSNETLYNTIYTATVEKDQGK
jgi:recombination protein RecA